MLLTIILTRLGGYEPIDDFSNMFRTATKNLWKDLGYSFTNTDHGDLSLYSLSRASCIYECIHMQGLLPTFLHHFKVSKEVCDKCYLKRAEGEPTIGGVKTFVVIFRYFAVLFRGGGSANEGAYRKYSSRMRYGH